MYTNRVFGTVKCVPFIEVSSFGTVKCVPLCRCPNLGHPNVSSFQVPPIHKGFKRVQVVNKTTITTHI